MADVHTPEIRSYNMSRIKGKDTKPEVIVRKYLFSQGFRYRKNVAAMPGKPDIVLPKYRTCIFVNGCFWHGHEGCKYFVWPKSNKDFWKEKINKNKTRDAKNYKRLENDGWKIIIVWECQLKKSKIDTTLCKLKTDILEQLQNR